MLDRNERFKQFIKLAEKLAPAEEIFMVLFAVEGDATLINTQTFINFCVKYKNHDNASKEAIEKMLLGERN